MILVEFPRDSKDILDIQQVRQDQRKEPKESKDVKDIHRLLQDQQSRDQVKHLFATRHFTGRPHQDMEILVLVQAMGDLLLDPNSAETLQHGLERDRKRALFHGAHQLRVR